MTYVEFVNRPLEIYSRIAHQVEIVQRLENICLNTTTTLGEKVQTSRQNTQEKKYAALADAQHKLNKMTGDLIDICDEVRNFFYENLSFDDADILEWKYINGKSINEISIIIDATYSGTASKISRAEKNARKAYKAKIEQIC